MKSILLTIVLCVLIHTNNFSQNLLNGSFEQWPIGCPYNTAPNNWTNFSTSLGPDQAGTCAGTVISHQGNSHMNLVWYSSNGLYEGALQVITGLTIGSVYQIQFYAINDQGLYSFGDPVFLDFYIDSSVVFSTPELFTGGAWTPYVVSFTATSTSQSIAFKVRAGSTGTSGSLGIDAVTITNLTGLNTTSNTNGIHIYPNPFSTATTIASENKFNDATLSIYTVFGQLVKEMKVHSTNSITFYRDDLETGIYLIKLTEKGKTTALNKLIIND